MKPIDEQGYLIMALNSPKVNYIDCAVRLARSIRQWHPDAKLCLVTDSLDYQDSLWTHYRVLHNIDHSNAWANDWQVFYHTPFRETVKLEADMIMASACDHWWTMFRHRDVVISSGCKNWRDTVSLARHYRKTFECELLARCIQCYYLLATQHHSQRVF